MPRAAGRLWWWGMLWGGCCPFDSIPAVTSQEGGDGAGARPVAAPVEGGAHLALRSAEGGLERTRGVESKYMGRGVSESSLNTVGGSGVRVESEYMGWGVSQSSLKTVGGSGIRVESEYSRGYQGRARKQCVGVRYQDRF